MDELLKSRKMNINYENAKKLLNNKFTEVETTFLQGKSIEKPITVKSEIDLLFSSGTQAYREVLLGCILVRILDNSKNIRHPYVDQGKDAFSGRTLDEKVVNPFLHSNRIPSSKGPYLSVFRRSIKFDRRTKVGVRDVKGYNAFLRLVSLLESIADNDQLDTMLSYLLYRFIQQREESIVKLSKLQRISLEQYGFLISALLETPSGGRIPVLLLVATFLTFKEFFQLNWEISWQGINVSDAASGASGDITIRDSNKILLAAEVTERPLDKQRIITTFNTKIASVGFDDYLFFVKKADMSEDVHKQMKQYFAQGHEINILEIRSWILISLSIITSKGRVIFNERLLELLDSPDVPKAIKLRWNELIQAVTSL